MPKIPTKPSAKPAKATTAVKPAARANVIEVRHLTKTYKNPKTKNP